MSAITSGRRIAGLDVGDKRIGVAISDATLTLAQPIGIIIHKGWGQNIQTLSRMLEPYETKRLVLGDPVQEDGLLSVQSGKIRGFGDALMRAGFEVSYWNERDTSREAADALYEAGFRERRRSGRIDAAAAALILQRYLDNNK